MSYFRFLFRLFCFRINISSGVHLRVLLLFGNYQFYFRSFIVFSIFLLILSCALYFFVNLVLKFKVMAEESDKDYSFNDEESSGSGKTSDDWDNSGNENELLDDPFLLLCEEFIQNLNVCCQMILVAPMDATSNPMRWPLAGSRRCHMLNV